LVLTAFAVHLVLGPEYAVHPEARIFPAMIVVVLGFPWGLFALWTAALFVKPSSNLEPLLYVGIITNFIIAVMFTRKCLRRRHL
jgi:hypothetical protein